MDKRRIAGELVKIAKEIISGVPFGFGSKDEDVVISFCNKKPFNGDKLSTDGKVLEGLGGEIAEWEGNKIVFLKHPSNKIDIVYKVISLYARKNSIKIAKEIISGDVDEKKVLNAFKPRSSFTIYQVAEAMNLDTMKDKSLHGRLMPVLKKLVKEGKLSSRGKANNPIFTLKSKKASSKVSEKDLKSLSRLLNEFDKIQGKMHGVIRDQNEIGNKADLREIPKLQKSIYSNFQGLRNDFRKLNNVVGNGILDIIEDD